MTVGPSHSFAAALAARFASLVENGYAPAEGPGPEPGRNDPGLPGERLSILRPTVRHRTPLRRLGLDFRPSSLAPQAVRLLHITLHSARVAPSRVLTNHRWPSLRGILSLALILSTAITFVAFTLVRTGGVAFSVLLLATAILLLILAGHGSLRRNSESPRHAWTDEPNRALGRRAGEALADVLRPTADLPRPERLPLAPPASASAALPLSNPKEPRLGQISGAPRQVLRSVMDPLRGEGQALIQIAKANRIDIEPYRVMLLDAREAALWSDMHTAVRSLALANEILRARIARHLWKAGRGTSKDGEAKAQADPSRLHPEKSWSQMLPIPDWSEEAQRDPRDRGGLRRPP